MKLGVLLGNDFRNAVVTLSSERLPMPVAYKLKKIFNKINEELTNYNDLLKKLREQHSIGGENSSKENEAEFLKDYEDLVNMEVEIEKIDISSIQNVNISTKDLVFLEPIINETSLS